MNKIRKIIKRLFGEELTIQHKLLNLILTVAFVGGMISLIFTMAIAINLTTCITIGILIGIVGVCLWLANIKNKPESASIIIVIVANLVLFPLMYFSGGGMTSGMPIWMVLGLIFSWLILKGRICVIMYILNAAVVVGCFVLEMLKPQEVTALTSRETAFLDMIQSILIVTCIFGAIFKYQSYVYEKQQLQLVKANLVKEEFLAQMSHEIRTPINAILGYNELIMKENQESNTVSHALNVQEAGINLLSMVNDLFEFANTERTDEFSNDFKNSAELEELEASDAKLLIVDDNSMNRDLLTRILKSTKVQIDIGTNGLEALELVRNNKYHLIFMDHMMPVMNGVETLKIMKKEKLCEGTPIIVLTANAVGDAEKEYLRVGFDAYLSKPISGRKLLQIMKRYLPPEVIGKNNKKVPDSLYFLDKEIGMTYCCNNEEFYKEMLNSYVAADKYDALLGNYEQENWEEYRILVHALKSTSLTIGAVEISEAAKELESAIKESRIDYVKQHHHKVMEDYRELLARLRDYLSQDEVKDELQEPVGDETQEHILVVDDDPMNLKVVEKLFRDEFQIDGVQSGKEALAFLEQRIPNLILLDLHMPEMDGYEVLRRIRGQEQLKDIPVVFLTADIDRESEIRGFREGAQDFIKKPFVLDIMSQRIKRILEYTRLQKDLQLEVKKQTRNAEARKEKVERLSLQIMLTLADTIDAKDRYTNGHSLRVAEYAREIAKRAGKSEQEQENVYFAGLLHDIGKIGIPNSIINKNTRLTEEEQEIIKNHPKIGADILENMSEIPELSVGAHWHHEKLDGSGYPDGLKGEKIPEIARIIQVADAYDAMASKRSYRDIMPQAVIKEEIEKGRGIQFDRQFAEIMLEMITEDAEYKMCEKTN